MSHVLRLMIPLMSASSSHCLVVAGTQQGCTYDPDVDNKRPSLKQAIVAFHQLRSFSPFQPVVIRHCCLVRRHNLPLLIKPDTRFDKLNSAEAPQLSLMFLSYQAWQPLVRLRCSKSDGVIRQHGFRATAFLFGDRAMYKESWLRMIDVLKGMPAGGSWLIIN